MARHSWGLKIDAIADCFRSSAARKAGSTTTAFASPKPAQAPNAVQVRRSRHRCQSRQSSTNCQGKKCSRPCWRVAHLTAAHGVSVGGTGLTGRSGCAHSMNSVLRARRSCMLGRRLELRRPGLPRSGSWPYDPRRRVRRCGTRLVSQLGCQGVSPMWIPRPAWTVGLRATRARIV